MAKKPLPPYVEFVREQLSLLGQITVRAMMGGYIVYCDGIVCALVANNELFLKGDAGNIPDFEARSLQAFRPFDDQEVTMKYFQAPPEIFEDPDELRRWVGQAIAAGRRSAAKKKASRKKA